MNGKIEQGTCENVASDMCAQRKSACAFASDRNPRYSQIETLGPWLSKMRPVKLDYANAQSYLNLC